MGKKIVIIALAAALLLAGCSSANEAATEPAASVATEAATQPAAAGEAATRTAPTDEIVMSMGEYSSSMEVYTYYFSNIRANLVSQAYQMGYTDENMSELWDLDQEGQTIRELLKESALQVSKEHAILYDMAVKAGAVANAEDIATDEAQVDSFLADVGGDEQMFLEAYLITPAQMKAVNARINLVDAYQQGIFEATEVTDEEIQAEYDVNKDLYDMVTVRHVLIMSDATMSEEDQADAEKRANDILARIQAGEDIGALAAELSEDPGSKDNNGEYVFGRGEMVEPFETWAFAAKVGDQGVVKTDYGFHVMELMADSSYESVKPLVEEELKISKAQVVFQDVPALVESPDWVVETAALATLEP
jgi:uncharacterized protein YcfL